MPWKSLLENFSDMSQIVIDQVFVRMFVKKTAVQEKAQSSTGLSLYWRITLSFWKTSPIKDFV